MIRSCLAAMVAVCLMGCGGSHSTAARPSDRHNYLLNHTIDHSLRMQECEDRGQQCLLEVCNYWQEACSAEPSYCHLENWMRTCIGSCVRKTKICESK